MIVLSQHTTIDTSGASTTLAYVSNITVGNLLVVAVRSGNDTGSVITITDSLSNFWTKGQGPNILVGVGSTQMSFAVANSSGACTITVTLNTSSTIRMGIYEFSGADPISPLDKDTNVAQDNSGTNTALQSASMTPSQDNELAFAFFGISTGHAVTAGANYTILDNVPATAKFATEYWIQTAATATTGNATIGAGDKWLAGLATFKSKPGFNNLQIGRTPHVPPVIFRRGK